MDGMTESSTFSISECFCNEFGADGAEATNAPLFNSTVYLWDTTVKTIPRTVESNFLLLPREIKSTRKYSM